MSRPEAHATGTSMAYRLVSYIPCDSRVRREILCEFNNAPSLRSIAAIRAKRLREEQALQTEPCKPHEGYYPDQVADALELANRMHVAAIVAERRRPRLRMAA